MQLNNRSKMKRLLIVLYRILPFLFFTLIIFGFDDMKVGAYTLICAVFHELGHISAARILVPKISVRSVLSGFRISFSHLNSYKDELIIAIAGPLTNLLIFALCLPFCKYGDFSLFAIMNLITALSNLLPIEGYDGYRMLSCAFSITSASETHHKVLMKTSFFLTSILCFLSLYFMAKFNGGYWIFFIFAISFLKKLANEPRVFTQEKTREKTRF